MPFRVFGHPEWIDFPREGNNWSYHHARRLWHLRNDRNLRYHHLGDFDEALLNYVNSTNIFSSSAACLLRIDEKNKVLAFLRGETCVVINFHPTRSLVDYALTVPPGSYTLRLDTDEARFGGHARLQPSQEWNPVRKLHGDVEYHEICLYLPARTGLLLQRRRPSDHTA